MNSSEQLPQNEKRFSRRDILQCSAAAALGALASGFGVNTMNAMRSSADKSAALDAQRKELTKNQQRIALGSIAAGGRATHDMQAALRTGYFDIVGWCDPKWAATNQFLGDRRRIYDSENAGSPDRYHRVHRSGDALLGDESVEAVTIATTPHWHAKYAIEALQSGRDVYLEKPMGLTIEEAQLLRQVVEKTGRILQVGTQRRSAELVLKAMSMIQEDKEIGDVTSAVCYCGVQTSEYTPEHRNLVEPVPHNLDWDLWQGPIPEERQYNHHRLGHHQWYDTSHGQISNWMSHKLSTAMQIMELDDQQPVRIQFHGVRYPKNDPDMVFTPIEFDVTFHYADGKSVRCLSDAKYRGAGIQFYGEDNQMIEIKDYAALELNGKRVMEQGDGVETTRDHFQNFYDCITARIEGKIAKPNSDVWSQANTTIAFLAGSIALQLGRSLQWSQDQEVFTGDGSDAANAKISRPQRKGYEINV